MNHTLTKLLIDVISDNIDFNTKIKDLILERNKAVEKALEVIKKELEKEKVI